MIKKGLNEPIINIKIHMSTVLLNRESTIGRFWNTTASPPGLSHRAPVPAPEGPLRGPQRGSVGPPKGVAVRIRYRLGAYHNDFL